MNKDAVIRTILIVLGSTTTKAEVSEVYDRVVPTGETLTTGEMDIIMIDLVKRIERRLGVPGTPWTMIEIRVPDDDVSIRTVTRKYDQGASKWLKWAGRRKGMCLIGQGGRC